jgi:hypothetical protein
LIEELNSDASLMDVSTAIATYDMTPIDSKVFSEVGLKKIFMRNEREIIGATPVGYKITTN